MSASDHPRADQFFHGTHAELSAGDLIEPGRPANFGWSSRQHVYFAPESNYGEAVRFAHHAARGSGAEPHVYQVEPTGTYDPDPEFAVSRGAFRSASPLRVIAEDECWKDDIRWNGAEAEREAG